MSCKSLLLVMGELIAVHLQQPLLRPRAWLWREEAAGDGARVPRVPVGAPPRSQGSESRTARRGRRLGKRQMLKGK